MIWFASGSSSASDEERLRRFRTLLTEQVYPSQIAVWSEGANHGSMDLNGLLSVLWMKEASDKRRSSR